MRMKMVIKIDNKIRILIILIIIGIILISGCATYFRETPDGPTIEKEIIEKFKTQEKVKVIIGLKDTTGIVTLQSDSKEEKEQKRKDKYDNYGKVAEEILDTLPNSTELIKKYREEHGNLSNLYLEITKEELDIIKRNSKVSSISLQGVVKLDLERSIPHIMADRVWEKEISDPNSDSCIFVPGDVSCGSESCAARGCDCEEAGCEVPEFGACEGNCSCEEQSCG